MFGVFVSVADVGILRISQLPWRYVYEQLTESTVGSPCDRVGRIKPHLGLIGAGLNRSGQSLDGASSLYLLREQN